MSPGEVRRLACDARLLPQVFGGESVPLDLGREERLFTRYQRIAIANRDGGYLECRINPHDGIPEFRKPGTRQWKRNHRWRPGGST